MTSTTAASLADTATWTADLEDHPVAIATSPDAVAVLGAAGNLMVLNRCGVVLGRAAMPLGGLSLAWSPQGDLLAVGGLLGAATWSLNDGLVSLPDDGWCAALAWTQHRHLATAIGRRAHVYKFGEQSTTPVRSWQTPAVASTVTGLTWLHDEQELAVAAYGGVTCFTRESVEVAESVKIEPRFAYLGSMLNLAASQDGRWLVCGNQDATVHIWGVDDGSELAMAGFPSKVDVVEFQFGSRWLYAHGGEQPTIWDFAGAGPDGRQPAMLQLDGPTNSTSHAWHPVEPLIAASDPTGEISLWQATSLVAGESNAPHAVLAAAGEPISALSWFSDDALIAATTSGQVFFVGQ